jgi:hypothetical protein
MDNPILIHAEQIKGTAFGCLALGKLVTSAYLSFPMVGQILDCNFL